MEPESKGASPRGRLKELVRRDHVQTLNVLGRKRKVTRHLESGGKVEEIQAISVRREIIVLRRLLVEQCPLLVIIPEGRMYQLWFEFIMN